MKERQKIMREEGKTEDKREMLLTHLYMPVWNNKISFIIAVTPQNRCLSLSSAHL